MKARHQRNKEKEHLAQVKKQHRKEFFANLKTVCNLIAGYDLYSKIPVAFLEKIYAKRLHQVRIEFDDEIISRSELNELSPYLKAALQTNYLELPNGKVEIDRLVIEGHSLTFFVKDLKDDEFPAAREIREALKDGYGDNYNDKFAIKLQQALFVFGVLVSSFQQRIIWAKMNLQLTLNKTAIQYTVFLEKMLPVKETFIVDGHPRPAYRVGWAYPFKSFTWAEISPLQPGLTQDKPIPVFIQAHALLRLQERTEIIPGPLHHSVFHSIQNLHYSIEKDGKVLIDYVYVEKKIGYLVGSVEDGRLLLHTFLFITNNGTPEGRKLSELTGLQVLDKKYLAIDKLRTFLSYKINENEFVKNIFVQAGCGHLLEIEDKNPFLLQPGETISAENIAHYLKVHRVV